jgi:hypothetical protein
LEGIVGLEWTQITNPMMDLLASGNKNSKSSSWVAKIQKLEELSLVGGGTHHLCLMAKGLDF